jgi:hypothetical protein
MYGMSWPGWKGDGVILSKKAIEWTTIKDIYRAMHESRVREIRRTL